MGERDWRLEATVAGNPLAPCPICEAPSETGVLLGEPIWVCPEHGMVFRAPVSES